MTPGAGHAPAAARNAWPILGVIEHELRAARSVLEIGTGTAQHAVLFAREMPWLEWYTSDLEENHRSIESNLALADIDNVHSPLHLDVRVAEPGDVRYDAVFSSNTAHIMDESAVEAMFDFVSRVLVAHGVFLLYGPFRINGEFTTDSNAAFDRSLRAQNDGMGLRDLERLDTLAGNGGMRRKRLYAMPSNNFIVVWDKTGAHS